MIDCFVLLDDCNATEVSPASRLYTSLYREYCSSDPSALASDWAVVSADIEAGRHVVVMADYEWGARLMQPACAGLPDSTGSLRFLVFEHMQLLSAEATDVWLSSRERADVGSAPEQSDGRADDLLPAGVFNLKPEIDYDGFASAIAHIHKAIRNGETYQVNFTYRIAFDGFGSPISLYRRLRKRQPVSYGALMALPNSLANSDCGAGPTWVLSCSPELFLRNQGGLLSARPMKGTAPRVSMTALDDDTVQGLAGDAKNRAENVMIVDLLRNDLGRIAKIGSVRVPKLFSVEVFPTVYQMTSSVEAELPEGSGLPDLLRALFPCGSITGAPKHRTMQIIEGLERSRRGIYTGSIGWVDKPDPQSQARDCGDFCFSVAIRTLVLNQWSAKRFRGSIGVGAGIVIDSVADQEFEECALKASFLTGMDPGFELFETMYATRADGIRHLELHLQRIAASAGELGFNFDRAVVFSALQSQVGTLSIGQASSVRLKLQKDGNFDISTSRIDDMPSGPVAFLVSPSPVDDQTGLLAHKTTLRSHYDQAICCARQAGAFDTLFWTGEGELTEGGRTNVFLFIDGQWLTPRLDGKVLPGIMRQVLLNDPTWRAREVRLTLSDLVRAERIVLTNALRGAIDAFVSPVKH